MRSLNRAVGIALIILAAAALASYLRAKGDRHRLGGATDLAGSLDPVVTEFNRFREHPRLLMVLAPACPVCLEGAKGVHERLLGERDDLIVLAVWMEALPFDITRNPARRVEEFAGEDRMLHFYDMEQVAGRALEARLDWPQSGLPWDVYLLYPPGVKWDSELPEPAAWFHQREEASPERYRSGPELIDALRSVLEAL